MHYDPDLPTAVFLGPSLDRYTAQRLLPAHYYPPVRMGDVYRLLATGVETIVIIDGVFHETTPVWQREIVAALDRGITVVGAASMGALRAAELWPLGMVGQGRIFEWYRDGVIAGDDEVALLHADEVLGYRPVSEPLVNIRFNLQRAVAQGLLEANEATALVAFARDRYFAERSFPLLLQAPVVAAMTPERRDALAALLLHGAQDLKRQDALAALAFCAERDAVPVPGARGPALPRPAVATAFPPLEAMKRGLLRPDGLLVEGARVLAAAAADDDWLAAASRRAGADFFLQAFAAEQGFRPGAEELERFRGDWVRRHVAGDLAPWLRGAGLTPDEFAESLAERALVEALLARPPEDFGLDFADHRDCVAALVSWYGDVDRARGAPVPADPEVLTREAAAGRYAVAWARGRGIEAPTAYLEDFVAAWERRAGIGSRADLLAAVGLGETAYLRVWSERAFYHWLLDQGPGHFGYGSFSLQRALLRELQLDGRAHRLALGVAEAGS